MARSNPLDNRRGPDARLPLAIGAASMALLAGAGLAGHMRTIDQRTQNVARAVEAAGWGQAAVSPMKGPQCWRARSGFHWKSASAEGWACAGPRDEVVLHRGAPSGRWP